MVNLGKRQPSPPVIVLCCVLAIIVAGWFSFRYLVDHKFAFDLEFASRKRHDIQVTITEGKRREEIARQLETVGICPAADFLIASQNKEGTLFPDTYRFFPNSAAADIVKDLVNNYQNRTSDLNPSQDDLILASIVEREALNNQERPIIAAVYLNRLKLGMPLQADPTVVYGKASNYLATNPVPPADYDYWPLITRADYQSVKSPYNTYLISGLPPSPIANPGKQSIEAVLNPAQHDYLFFAHKDGQLLLAKTLAEHESQLR